MANKTKTLGVRVEAEVAAQLQELNDRTDIDGVALARHAIRAALRYWKEHGEITLPLVCIPVIEYERLKRTPKGRNGAKER